MKYLLILLFINCNSQNERKLFFQVNEFEKESYDVTVQDMYHQIEFIGDWKRNYKYPNPSPGKNEYACWPLEEGHGKDTARYRFYGYGIEVYTELRFNHIAYNVYIDNLFHGKINTYDEGKYIDTLTFKIDNLSHGNHVLELTSAGGYYVLNKLRILYSPNPWADDPLPNLPSDTIYIHDTIYIINTIKEYYLLKPKFEYDTLKL